MRRGCQFPDWLYPPETKHIGKVCEFDMRSTWIYLVFLFVVGCGNDVVEFVVVDESSVDLPLFWEGHEKIDESDFFGDFSLSFSLSFSLTTDSFSHFHICRIYRICLIFSFISFISFILSFFSSLSFLPSFPFSFNFSFDPPGHNHDHVLIVLM